MIAQEVSWRSYTGFQSGRRIQYKVLTLVHKCLVCRVPRYLAELLVEYPYAERRQGLRSQNLEKRLVEPRVKFKTFAARSFGYVGPRWWNMLPKCPKEHKQY